MKKTCDLAVIGAGFAGLACAHAAAWRGLRAIVLDAKDHPGQRPHTTGILVKEVADAWDIPRGMTRKIHGVRLYAPSLRSIDLVRQGYYFLATDTAWLMRWWSREAIRAGAEVKYGVKFDAASLQREKRTFTIGDIEARFLVGADGPRSAVARELGLGINRKFLTGVEAEFEGVRGVPDDLLHVFIDPKLAPGYIAWVVPGVVVTQVGLAARRGTPLRLEEFVGRVAKLFDFTAARETSRRGGLIPVGGPVSPIGRDNALLIGDAAGLVSPLTAGGIHTALQSGRAAGLAISDHLLDAGPDPAFAVRDSIPSFTTKKLLRHAIDLPIPTGLYDMALRSATLRSAAQTIFFHHRGLMSLETWRDLWTNVVMGVH